VGDAGDEGEVRIPDDAVDDSGVVADAGDSVMLRVCELMSTTAVACGYGAALLASAGVFALTWLGTAVCSAGLESCAPGAEVWTRVAGAGDSASNPGFMD